MLNALNTVRGAVATKDLIPVLQAISVYGSRIQGTNGRLTIDAPCADLRGYNFIVPCAPFLKAVDSCNGEPVLTVKPDGSSINVKRGTFKVNLPLDTTDSFPHQLPSGQPLSGVSGDLLPTLKVLRAFVSEDESRQWACGILFKDGVAYATNNVVVASMPTVSFPSALNLPRFFIDELLRLKREPIEILADDRSITFKFEDTSWIKSSLLATEWPPVEKMIPTSVEGIVLEGLLSAVEQITPFCNDAKQPVILFGSDGIKTLEGDKSAHFEGFDLPYGAYRSEPLGAVLRAADQVDFTTYPKPCPFAGPNGLKGLMIGVKI